MEGVIKMDILQWIAQYWVNWVCALVAGGVIAFAKHYIKIQKEALDKKWQEKEKNMCGKIICTFEEEIQQVKSHSEAEDNKIHQELDHLRSEINTIESGVLSIQGKQFRELCEEFLQKSIISIEEYEDFEAEYEVYRSLGGNHKGDALHERVVKKYDAQNSK